jgi:hypothetical protein
MMAIACEPDIDFDPLEGVGNGELDRGSRVLGRPNHCPAMSHDLKRSRRLHGLKKRKAFDREGVARQGELRQREE